MSAPAKGSRAPASLPASDGALLGRIALGDSGALGELYDRYREPLRRFIARATGDGEDTDDLVHATFLAAAGVASKYDGRPCCRPWLIGIAVQHLRRRRHTSGRFFGLLKSFAQRSRTDADPRPSLEARRDVERALRLVSEQKRVTLLMAEIEGMSCPEIAAALAIPVGTVWTRLHAARRELRAALEGEGDA